MARNYLNLFASFCSRMRINLRERQDIYILWIGRISGKLIVGRNNCCARKHIYRRQLSRGDF
jgi:hypothetical protein